MKTLFTKEELEHLKCYECGKDLMNPPNGHVVMNYTWAGDKIVVKDIQVVCKRCDSRRNGGAYKKWAWKDIPDLTIPDYLVQWILGIVVDLHKKNCEFSDSAMEELMKLILIVFKDTSKEPTRKQIERLKMLHELPRMFGGLGE